MMPGAPLAKRTVQALTSKMSGWVHLWRALAADGVADSTSPQR